MLYALEKMVAGTLKSQFGGRRRIIPGRTANLTQAIGERAACQYRDACWLGCPYGAYFSPEELYGRLSGLRVTADDVPSTVESIGEGLFLIAGRSGPGTTSAGSNGVRPHCRFQWGLTPLGRTAPALRS
jgi:hypothetical protein